MEKLIFERSIKGRKGYSLPALDVEKTDIKEAIPQEHIRTEDAALPEVSESEVARHFNRLAHLNYNIEEGMYPLGSCTMKYNPKVNETIASLEGFADLHPFTRPEFAQGALKVMYELGESLKTITGLQGVSLQPAAGSQGELTGILMIRQYHLKRGDHKRKKILIPDAAHGTNPASAAMGGFEIVTLKSNDKGRIDLDDLKSKCNEETAGFMLTNPNTVGIFEKDIKEINNIIHEAGGLSYMDGANMNALLGIAKPGDMGFDVIHLNLHKTFSTPHGGGGPGAGPVCVSDALVDYLPVPQIEKEGDTYKIIEDRKDSIGKLHSFFGNFGVLVRAYAYIRLNGAEGLREVSENAIINANYLRSRIRDNFIIPYEERPMHEFVVSADKQKENGVAARDISKRILDFGFHSPTNYFPLIVHECLLIEPTETETIENIDAYADVLNQIAEESEKDPDFVKGAPYNTPLKRLDEALAARNLNVRWQPEEN